MPSEESDARRSSRDLSADAIVIEDFTSDPPVVGGIESPTTQPFDPAP